MTQEARLTFQAFFAGHETDNSNLDFLHAAIRAKKAVRIRMLKNEVRVETLPPDGGAVRVCGQWRSEDFARAPLDDASVKILLPLLCEITEITLPASQMYTGGRPYRPVADFMMRNLFIAASCNAPVAVDSGSPPETARENVLQLRQRYYFILKAFLNEDALETRSVNEIADILLANLYLPMLKLEHPLLKAAQRRLGEVCFEAGSRAQAGAFQARLLAARARMQPHF